MKDKTCPTCGRDDFKNRRGMKCHHKHTHGESIQGEPVSCSFCGDMIRVTPARREDQDVFYCDRSCEAKDDVSDGILEQFPEYTGGKIEVQCANCLDTLRVKPHRFVDRENVFCDKQCHGEWISENKSGQNNQNWSGRVEKVCSYCGDTKKVKPSRADRSEHYFCDEDCMYDWRSENWVGEDAPAWSGGTARQNYGEGWTRQREKAKQRDFHRCRCCNISEEEALDEYGEGLHVHHRTPFKLFDNSAEANKIRNLLTLCKSCHHALEWEFNRQTVGFDSKNTDHGQQVHA